LYLVILCLEGFLCIVGYLAAFPVPIHFHCFTSEKQEFSRCCQKAPGECDHAQIRIIMLFKSFQLSMMGAVRKVLQSV
jgi:hypothetical protein